MVISAGILLIQDNKILLCHPTNSKWYGTYGIPKGHVEEDEDVFDAAMREFFEETGIKIKIPTYEKAHIIYYKDKEGKTYKELHYFVVRTSGLDLVVPKTQLQTAEVDWAGFLSKDEASKRLFWRQKEILNYIS